MEALDFLGQLIQVGSKVVFVQLGYRNLLTGVVIKITPKTLLIKHPKTNIGSTESRQCHDQVIVVDRIMV